MKTLITFIFCLIISGYGKAQEMSGMPSEKWTAYNREVSFDNDVIHLNAQSGDGLLWLSYSNFKNGIIELDIKGKNAPGQSFVGLAFHGKDDATYDAVYFRPFNFKNPDRSSHSVQYISMPENDWFALRNAYPGKYEKRIDPVPNPVDEWFHVRIVVNYPQVKVYINGSTEPSLEVEQISDRRHGAIGLWVGNGSEGWFKNLEVKSRD